MLGLRGFCLSESFKSLIRRYFLNVSRFIHSHSKSVIHRGYIISPLDVFKTIDRYFLKLSANEGIEKSLDLSLDQ